MAPLSPHYWKDRETVLSFCGIPRRIMSPASLALLRTGQQMQRTYAPARKQNFAVVSDVGFNCFEIQIIKHF